ncbi:dephospho-CoA kinase [Methanolinea mesophila]|uniref:AAA family ATPase n=1 Tax=Methanolinea mesophila TaxID=547055 RepID=UPI001AE5DF88|nr:AAA family ATPase [Methanolinea mesophila]MBP1928272.1 dephospho-CoA kinase [Methanolinea mesophila]
MKVIGVVGLPASGKGEFSRVAREMGIPIVVMGDVIRNEVQAAGLPLTDQNLGGTATRLREEEGMDAIAKRCIPLIEALDAPLVLVDGIRGETEVRLFRARFPEFYLVGIDAPFSVRLGRLASRGRSDDFISEEELIRRDRREIGWGLGEALIHADYVLDNGDGLEKFADDARALLAELKGEA